MPDVYYSGAHKRAKESKMRRNGCVGRAQRIAQEAPMVLRLINEVVIPQEVASNTPTESEAALIWTVAGSVTISEQNRSRAADAGLTADDLTALRHCAGWSAVMSPSDAAYYSQTEDAQAAFDFFMEGLGYDHEYDELIARYRPAANWPFSLGIEAEPVQVGEAVANTNWGAIRKMPFAKSLAMQHLKSSKGLSDKQLAWVEKLVVEASTKNPEG